MIYILGAGMAGCLAGLVFRDAKILEAGPKISEQHQAVLRFRSDKVSRLTGIPFKKVTVHKSIWFEGRDHPLTPQVENLYSIKVVGAPKHRSISVGSYERWIAPDNFHVLLGAMLAGSINFDQTIYEVNERYIHVDKNYRDSWDRHGFPVISTLPLPFLADMLNRDHPPTNKSEFAVSKIAVIRIIIPNADVYQTIYFPDQWMDTYRVSITGDKLIVEMICNSDRKDEALAAYAQEIEVILSAFGLDTMRARMSAKLEDVTIQNFGKIDPLPDNARKQFLFDVSSKYNIWSLGRFACWRNILLDDVHDDIYKIRSMIDKSVYDNARITFKED